MTSVPYPTFTDANAVLAHASLSAVGRCRILLDSTANSDYRIILAKCLEQSHCSSSGGVDNSASNDEKEKQKKLQKKLMKEGVALASTYLQTTLGLDVSVIDVEVHFIHNQDIIATDGCTASCFLDAGAARIVVSSTTTTDEDDNKEEHQSARAAIDAARIPRDRLAVHCDFQAWTTPLDWTKQLSIVSETMRKVQNDCSSISVLLTNVAEYQTAVSDLFALSQETKGSVDMVVQLECPSSNGEVDSKKDEDDDDDDDDSTNLVFVDLVGRILATVPETTTGTTVSIVNPTASLLGRSYASCLSTDRTDGLYTTVVCTRTGEALGLVYSSIESIVAALECGRGVYYSRSRKGLWRKGDTSGHYQTLHRIDVDCDGDALRFTVTQRHTETSLSPAFCHLETLTCWGPPRGLSHLEATLRERLVAAPLGSYTKRLFDDEELLREKLVEEAQELAEADTKEHVAEELADVLYFCMVRAAKFGVSMDDAAAELDRRTRKVTRRAGDSKGFRIEAAKEILSKVKENK